MDAKQPGVDVDLGGLRMVADSLRAETEEGWRPGATRAQLELDHGTRFGTACPGGQITAASDLFGIVLDQALENTVRQIWAVEKLARDIEVVLANYGAADDVATKTLRTVEGWTA